MIWKSVICEHGTETVSGTKLIRLLSALLIIFTCVFYIVLSVFKDVSVLAMLPVLSLEFSFFVMAFFDQKNRRKISVEFSKFKYSAEGQLDTNKKENEQ